MTSPSEPARTCENCNYSAEMGRGVPGIRCLLTNLAVQAERHGCVFHQWREGDFEYAPGFGQRPIGDGDV